MSDPWWFRGRRFAEQVEGLDASVRRDVLDAVAHDTRWYRRIALTVFTCFALAGIVVFVHDFAFPADGARPWRHEYTPFFGVVVLAWVIVSERIDLVTSRQVRVHEQRDPHAEPAAAAGRRL